MRLGFHQQNLTFISPTECIPVWAPVRPEITQLPSVQDGTELPEKIIVAIFRVIVLSKRRKPFDVFGPRAQLGSDAEIQQFSMVIDQYLEPFPASGTCLTINMTSHVLRPCSPR